MPVPFEVWSTKTTSQMTKLHEASSEHAVWEEEEEKTALPAPRFKPELLSLLTLLKEGNIHASSILIHMATLHARW